LHALPAVFGYLIVRPLVWNLAQRPIPENFLGAVTPEDMRVEDWDVALLHLDQWCDGRNNLRALPYRITNLVAQEMPRIVIMHGTPDDEENRQAILQLIGDLPVVCNSYQAAGEWDGGEGRHDRYGLEQFRVIIHGYDVDEFWSEPLEGRRQEAITICSGGTISREYHGIPLVERLMRDVEIAWYGPRGNQDWLPNYRAYREMLASSLIYFSPTRRAPMPGARTEAMLSGCCVVTVPGNDVERFHGRTGFVVRTYEQARDTLRALLRDPGLAWEVGQKGREVAREMFGRERFVGEWMRVLGELGIGG